VKGLPALVLGIFGTFAFSWVGLILIPNAQIGHLDPQSDEDGTDIYPMPQSGMVARGRQVYAANGCVYCHTQQVRADYISSDIERKWGVRRSAPRDYIFQRPVFLGKMRMGPDLANVGHRQTAASESPSPAPGASPAPPGAPATASASQAATTAAVSPSPASNAAASPAASPAVAAKAPATSPAPEASPAPAVPPTPSAGPAEPTDVVNGTLLPYTAAWHHRHLYNPRSVVTDSDMPSYRFLYEKRRIIGEASGDSLNFAGAPEEAPPADWEIVPTYDAKCLVAYLMSLDQSHPLKEVKSVVAIASPTTAAPAPVAAAPAAKEAK
jgi:cbb3-type cytochrome oxidase cytochrome c subunit